MTENCFGFAKTHNLKITTLEDIPTAERIAEEILGRDPKEEARARITEDMRRSGLSPRLHPVEGGNALISAELPGDSEESLLFYNHYDVVEPGRPENWTNGLLLYL